MSLSARQQKFRLREERTQQQQEEEKNQQQQEGEKGEHCNHRQ